MMKKIILILTVLAILLVSCSGGDGTPVESTVVTTTAAVTEDNSPALTLEGDTYVITEEKYLEGVQEIYQNPDKYVGKRVQLEGVYIAELYVDEMYYQVYRNINVTERHEDEDGHVHTHAGETHPIGFRFKYDGNKPQSNTFVKLAGVVEQYDAGGETMLLIRADTLEKCETPGKTVLYY